MNWVETDVDSSEFITISERLNKCRESKKLLELELSNEEFNRKYISKRKELTVEKTWIRMYFAVPAILILIYCVTSFFRLKTRQSVYGFNRFDTFSMMVSLMIFLFVVYPAVRLWIPELKMLRKLTTRNKDREKGVVSFKTEAINSDEKIVLLKKQLENIQKEIDSLVIRQNEQMTILKAAVLEQKKTRESNSLFNGKFKLQRDVIGEQQLIELIDLYDREIKISAENIARLETEEKKLAREIIDIKEEYKLTKKKVYGFFLAMAVLSLVQNIFEGKLYTVMGVIFGIGLVVYFVYLMEVGEKVIIRYLVEKENKIIQDYAFVHNLQPVSRRKNEVALEISCEQKWLEDCQARKQSFQNEIDELIMVKNDES